MEDQKTKMSGTQWFLLGWLIVAVSVLIAGLRQGEPALIAVGSVMAVATLFIGTKNEA